MKKKLVIITGLMGLMILAGISLCSANLQYEETYTSPGGTNKVLIIVNSAIYEPVLASLMQYKSDLEAEDYKVTLTKFLNGTPLELKGYLKAFPDLKGVILVGDLPVPWFEIQKDFDWEYASFPCDLFYMDLDGVWLDTDNNGAYDVHIIGNTGDLGPEIWLGRLTASTLGDQMYFSWRTQSYANFIIDMDEAGLLRNYFAKVHAYRTGAMPVAQRGLAYIDDDWSGWTTVGLETVYSDANAITINDKATTSDIDYEGRLKENYEWIHIFVHSGPEVHVFNNNWFNAFYFKDLRDRNPNALFYNLFACSNARYTETNYMGGHYIFTKDYGLAAIGSTKTGSMLFSQLFYPHLGPAERKNIGEAYKLWFREMDLFDPGWKSWFYGMTLLGDPTLTLDPPIASINFITPSLASAGAPVKFSGSAKISQGGIAAYRWYSDKDGYLKGYDGNLINNSYFETSLLTQGEHRIYFKVQDDKGRWSSAAGYPEVIKVMADETPPANPAVTDEGNSTASTSQLYASWSAEDKESEIIEYQYKISQGSQEGGIIRDWTSTGRNTNITAIGLSLTEGQAYYFAVKAKNAAGLWSYAGYSDGITIKLPETEPVEISSLGLFPNYYSSYYIFYFRLNQKARVTAQIWSADYKRLINQFTKKAQCYPGFNFLFWYGNDSFGRKVRAGRYLLKVMATDSAGQTTFSFKSFVTK